VYGCVVRPVSLLIIRIRSFFGYNPTRYSDDERVGNGGPPSPRAPTPLVPVEIISASTSAVVEAEAEAVAVDEPKPKRRKVKGTATDTQLREAETITKGMFTSRGIDLVFRYNLGRFTIIFISFSVFQVLCCNNPTSTTDTCLITILLATSFVALINICYSLAHPLAPSHSVVSKPSGSGELLDKSRPKLELLITAMNLLTTLKY
jgi:hypothetical protein